MLSVTSYCSRPLVQRAAQPAPVARACQPDCPDWPVWQVGAAVADKLAERNWGNLVLALDPALLGEPEAIRGRVQVTRTPSLESCKGQTRSRRDKISDRGRKGKGQSWSRLHASERCLC